MRGGDKKGIGLEEEETREGEWAKRRRRWGLGIDGVMNVSSDFP